MYCTISKKLENIYLLLILYVIITGCNSNKSDNKKENLESDYVVLNVPEANLVYKNDSLNYMEKAIFDYGNDVKFINASHTNSLIEKMPANLVEEIYKTKEIAPYFFMHIDQNKDSTIANVSIVCIYKSLDEDLIEKTNLSLKGKSLSFISDTSGFLVDKNIFGSYSN